MQNVIDTLDEIFTNSKARQEARTVKINTMGISTSQLNDLSYLNQSYEVSVKRSGLGLVLIVKDPADG